MVWILLGVVILMVIILLSKIYISCKYTYKKDDQTLVVSVYMYRIRLLTKDIELTTSDRPEIWHLFKNKSFLESLKYIYNGFQKAIDQSREANAMIIMLLRNLYFHRIDWSTHIGTGEASTTGITVGGVWTLKGVITGLLYNKSSFKCEPDLKVIPHYQHKYIHSKLDCMVSIRLVKAIYALIKVMRKVPLKEKALI
ncbi:DUF2953 domain-containing protein [Virgibacillus byunsanensis]|uniref:DUF2953 domain-containing protein n=1 Tax=Virgibacillus byunsanensis TaxID=570945 RepID=A0ABW3LIC7_9BACI